MSVSNPRWEVWIEFEMDGYDRDKVDEIDERLNDMLGDKGLDAYVVDQLNSFRGSGVCNPYFTITFDDEDSAFSFDRAAKRVLVEMGAKIIGE